VQEKERGRKSADGNIRLDPVVTAVNVEIDTPLT